MATRAADDAYVTPTIDFLLVLVATLLVLGGSLLVFGPV